MHHERDALVHGFFRFNIGVVRILSPSPILMGEGRAEGKAIAGDNYISGGELEFE